MPSLQFALGFVFSFDTRQCLGNHFGRGFLKAAFACAAKVMRGLKQAKQRGSLFGERGLCAEVFAGEVGKAEFVFGGEFPSEVKLDGGAQGLRIAHQVGGRGLFKLEQ